MAACSRGIVLAEPALVNSPARSPVLVVPAAGSLVASPPTPSLLLPASLGGSVQGPPATLPAP